MKYYISTHTFEFSKRIFYLFLTFFITVLVFSCEEKESFYPHEMESNGSREIMNISLEQTAQLIGGLIRTGNTAKIPLEVEIIKDYKAPQTQPLNY